MLQPVADFLLLLNSQLGYVVYFLFELVALLLIANAVSTARTSQGAIAWAVALVALPIVVVPAYLLFGQRRFYGYVEARRRGNTEIHRIAAQMLSEMKVQYAPDEHPVGGFVLEALAQMPFTKGNRAQLLIDGDEKFDALLASIAGAKRYVVVQYYIFRDDEIGHKLQSLLLQKAKQGVAVYVLYDAVGSFSLRSRFEQLRDVAGIQLHPFKTVRYNFRGRYQINFRNHRKIVVVDGVEAFLGGMNVGDEYLGRHRRLSPWRDTHIKLRGPAVQGVQLSFLEDWYWATDAVPQLNWTPQVEPEDQQVLILPTGPADPVESCGLMFMHAINSAKHRLWIVSPYFLPDEAIMQALRLAVLRGVEVKVLLPRLSDNRIAQLAMFSFVDEMLDSGVKFFLYQPGFVHQKVVLVDDKRSYVGTANMDNRSFRLNFELTAVVRDAHFAREAETMLEQDFSNALLLTQEAISRRSWLTRWSMPVARLFSPLL